MKHRLSQPPFTPTMGKSFSPFPVVYTADSAFIFPKAIVAEDKYINLEGVRTIRVFDKGGYIKYTDGKEVLLDKKEVATLQKLLIVAALQPDKKPENPEVSVTSEKPKKADTPNLSYALFRCLETIVAGFVFGFGLLFGIRFAMRFL